MKTKATRQQPEAATAVAEEVKVLLGNSADRIRLDDFVTALLKSSLEPLAPAHFSPNGTFSREQFQDRVQRYEVAMRDLISAIMLINRWGNTTHLPLIEKILTRVAEANPAASGMTAWLLLRAYPLGLLMYAGGIAASVARNYAALGSSLLTCVSPSKGATESVPLVVHVTNDLMQLDQAFGELPGRERARFLRSDHIFGLLQPTFEEALFLGGRYETAFDEFEILSALAFADLNEEERGGVWAPPGRFASKRRLQDKSPYRVFVREAEERGERWEALSAGFFRRSPKRFSEIAAEYGKFLGNLYPY